MCLKLLNKYRHCYKGEVDMVSIVGKLAVSFSEQAFDMFDTMFTEIERKGTRSPNSTLITNALATVCGKFGYSDKDAFWNAYLCWDVERSF